MCRLGAGEMEADMITPLTRANIENVLTKCFLEFWDKRTPVVLKNQVQVMMPPETPAWVYYVIQVTASRQESFGSHITQYLRVGRIMAEVFVGSGLVTGLQNEYVSAIFDYYERSSFSPLRILNIMQVDLPDGAHRRASITGDGKWFGTQVNVQWAFTETKKGVEQWER